MKVASDVRDLGILGILLLCGCSALLDLLSRCESQSPQQGLAILGKSAAGGAA